MKKLFFTIFVVLFFSLLFAAESAIKAVMKLFGYVPGVSRQYGYPGNNEQQRSHHS